MKKKVPLEEWLEENKDQEIKDKLKYINN